MLSYISPARPPPHKNGRSPCGKCPVGELQRFQQTPTLDYCEQAEFNSSLDCAAGAHLLPLRSSACLTEKLAEKSRPVCVSRTLSGSAGSVRKRASFSTHLLAEAVVWFRALSLVQFSCPRSPYSFFFFFFFSALSMYLDHIKLAGDGELMLVSWFHRREINQLAFSNTLWLRLNQNRARTSM